MGQIAHKLGILFKFLKNSVINGVFIAVFGSFSMVHAVETVYWVDNQSGVAMAGYDPISYFLRGEGGYGDYHYEYFWSGAVWRFQNEGNLRAFREYPLIYAPQYGGFDALKMSSSVSVTPDPYYNDVYDNRLYLFHDKKNLDIWLRNREKYIRAAQKNWQLLHDYEMGKNFEAPEIEPDDSVMMENAETEEEKVLKKMNELDQKNTAEAAQEDSNAES